MADHSPPPLDAARRQLADQGYCVVESVLDTPRLRALHEATYRLAAFDREHGWARDYHYGNDASANQRIWNLISRDPIFCQLVEHDLAIDFVTRAIGWPALMGRVNGQQPGRL